MNEDSYTFHVYSEKGDDVRIALSLYNDYIPEAIISQGISVYDITLIRDVENSQALDYRIMSEVSSRLLMFMIEHPGAILFFMCDYIHPISCQRDLGISCQEYRSRLFSGHFERKRNILQLFDFHNNRFEFGDEYIIHIIYRDCHQSAVEAIKKELDNLNSK